MAVYLASSRYWTKVGFTDQPIERRIDELNFGILAKDGRTLRAQACFGRSDWRLVGFCEAGTSDDEALVKDIFREAFTRVIDLKEYRRAARKDGNGESEVFDVETVVAHDLISEACAKLTAFQHLSFTLYP